MLKLNAYMVSCRARDSLRARTLASLSASGWNGPVKVEMEEGGQLPALERYTAAARRVLRCASQDENTAFLFLEDDLKFNRYFARNLGCWQPLLEITNEQHFYASLYNPGVTFSRRFEEGSFAEASVSSVFGSQALVISRLTAHYLLTYWGVEPWPNVDIRLARLATRVCPLLYHTPSLVEHVGTESLWGGPFHHACDFDREWKAPALHIRAKSLAKE